LPAKSVVNELSSLEIDIILYVESSSSPSFLWWWAGIVIAHWSRSMMLTYVSFG